MDYSQLNFNYAPFVKHYSAKKCNQEQERYNFPISSSVIKTNNSNPFGHFRTMDNSNNQQQNYELLSYSNKNAFTLNENENDMQSSRRVGIDRNQGRASMDFYQLIDDLNDPSLLPTPIKDCHNYENNPLAISHLQNEAFSYHTSQKNSSRINSKSRSSKKLDIHSMVSQLDDLKDQIKSLEQKIDYSTLNTQQSTKQINQQNNKKSQCKQSPHQSKHKAKNISWGNSHVYIQTSNNVNKMNMAGIGSLPTDSSLGIEEYEVRSNKNSQREYQNKENLKEKQINEKGRSILKNNFNQASHQKTPSQIQDNNFPQCNSYHSLNNQPISIRESQKNSQRVLANDSNLQKYTNLDQQTLDLDNHIVKTKQLPSSQQEFLNIKLREVEKYKDKYKKMQKQNKKLKEELQEKDQLLQNYNDLNKEIKVIKEQWIVSEKLRNEQKKQLKQIQDQLRTQQKSNLKLKQKLIKVKEKIKDPIQPDFPIKVTVEEKQIARRSYNNDQHL